MNDDEYQYFDLRAAVRAVIAETDLTSPEEIAGKVAEGVPDGVVREVLRVALREYVRTELVRDRAKPTPPAPTGATAGSAKVRAIRNAAPAWLHDRVCVGEQWLLLADCTLDDLRYLEADRLAAARRAEQRATKFGALAALVDKHKVARVGDLPAKVLAKVEWSES